MHTTPPSLLSRLHEPGDQAAWVKFIELYTPLLFHSARRLTREEHAAEDLVQDTFEVLLKKLPQFEYDPKRSFRSWLRSVVTNLWLTKWRTPSLPMAGADEQAAEVACPDGLVDLAEEEYRQRLAQRALELMESDFEQSTWKACWEQVINGKTPEQVAVELNISIGAARVAKCRVLHRLRQELAGLLD